MATVMGLVGSPRRGGNTDRLIDQVLEGAAETGANIEKVFLADLQIRECDGCHVCWTGKPCSKNDDMNALYARMGDCDALVFGTPVYWYGPTALMKGLVDRLVYFNCPENRPKIQGKRAAIVVPFEEDNPSTAELVVSFFNRCFQYLEMNLAGQVLVPGVTRRGEVCEKPRALEAARNLGSVLAAQAEISG